MGKHPAKGKMNQTQKEAYRRLCEVFGERAFYAHVPSKERRGSWGGCYHIGKRVCWVTLSPSPEPPRDNDKHAVWMSKYKVEVQMRRGTWFSLVKRGLLFEKQGVWFIEKLRVHSRIQLLMEVA